VPRDAEKSLIGRTIADKYAIESLIGRGAMGSVYRARQTALDKPVAVKVMHRWLEAEDSFSARFHREARAAARLDHPNSIRVTDFGEEPDGLLYIIMELAEGRDLERVAAESFPLPDARVADILSQVLAALGVAHDLGVVHRDLKPENILVLPGIDDRNQPVDVVKVCDFGIATIAEPRSDPEGKSKPRSSITATGHLVGTPEYMSPEQAQGEPVDARTDLYSAGVVLFRLLTGALPFRSETAIGMAIKHIYEEPERPSALVAGVHPKLEAICLKAMRKHPAERYQTAREMRAELRAALDLSDAAPGVRVVPPPPSTSPAPLRPSDGELFAPTLEAPVPAPRPSPSPAPKRPARFALPVLAIAGVAAIVLLAAQRRPSLSPAFVPPSASTEATGVQAPSGARAPAWQIDPPSPVRAIDPPAPAPSPVAPPDRSAGRDREPAPSIARVPDRPPPAVAPPSPATAIAADPPPPALVAAPPPPDPPDPPAPVAAPPPAPQPAPAPAPGADPEAARVVVGGVVTTAGVLASNVRAALGHAPFTRCYRDALRAGVPAPEATATLHLAIDDTGHVTSATLAGPALPQAARSCIEAAARSLRINNVDTGDATADAALSFLPR
jgi:eukaryotic-like serine/threonine-protein kinase